MINYQPSVLGHQFLEVLIVGGVGRDLLGLVPGNVTGESFALLAALQIVIGPIGALPDDTEFAGLHALDLGDLLEQRLRRFRRFHGRSIYYCIY